MDIERESPIDRSMSTSLPRMKSASGDRLIQAARVIFRENYDDILVRYGRKFRE
jgi:hypothetical protein